MTLEFRAQHLGVICQGKDRATHCCSDVCTLGGHCVMHFPHTISYPNLKRLRKKLTRDVQNRGTSPASHCSSGQSMFFQRSHTCPFSQKLKEKTGRCLNSAVNYNWIWHLKNPEERQNRYIQISIVNSAIKWGNWKHNSLILGAHIQ